GGSKVSNQPPPSTYVITTTARGQKRLAITSCTISPTQRSPAPTVDDTAWALSFQCGFTKATEGRPPARSARTNSDASRMWERPSGVSMMRFTYWNGLWWGMRPCFTGSAPPPQPVAYQAHAMPAASSRSAIVGTVCGIFKICAVRCGGYGGAGVLMTPPRGGTTP